MRLLKAYQHYVIFQLIYIFIWLIALILNKRDIININWYWNIVFFYMTFSFLLISIIFILFFIKRKGWRSLLSFETFLAMSLNVVAFIIIIIDPYQLFGKSLG